MGNLLDSPRTEKVDIDAYVSSSGLVCGACGMQGWRLEMEDAHIVKDMPSLPNHLFLAVFDGHGGSGAAIYAAKNLVQCIENTPLWKEYVFGGRENVELLGQALQQAFLTLDEDLRRYQERAGDPSGCTAVTAMVTPGHIICANSGDSRCVFGYDNQCKPLSADHKPYDEAEKKRIETAGGCVQWKRVDGDLAVSRAFGDFQYKNRPDLPARNQKVTCFPDIDVWTRTPGDELLVLGCDGVWDVMSSQEGVDLVRQILLTGEENMEQVAEELIDIALQKGSRDNISAVVVKFPGAPAPTSTGGVAGLRVRREKENPSKS